MVSLQEFEPLKPAELAVMSAAARGKPCPLGSARPQEATAENEVRADFIRFLALGGGDGASVHESGLRVQGAYIQGDVNLNGAKDIRPLWLTECRIAGAFTVSDASTRIVSLDGTAVKLVLGDGLKAAGSLLLRQATIAEVLRLNNAEIVGTLSCDGCVIKGRPWRSQRMAAELTALSVGGNIEFRRGFTADGLIVLDDADIGGTFDCSEGLFRAGDDPARAGRMARWDRNIRALKCHRLQLSGSLYLRDTDCEGELSFTGAQIGGDVDCRNGKFRWAGTGEPIALSLKRIEAGGNIYLSEGFEAMGRVQLNGARVRSNVDCRGGAFNAIHDGKAKGGPGFSDDAMSLVNAEIGGALIVATLAGRPEEAAVFNGSLDLKSAQIRVLVDSRDSWPKRKHQCGLTNVIHLDGFTYERFSGDAPTDAHMRKQWLKRQPPEHVGRDFKPQPFEQLVKVLKSMGHSEEARRIAIERQGFVTRRQIGMWRTRPLRALAAVLWAVTAGLLIGHGYRPLRVLVIMAMVGLGCGYYFKLAAEGGVFAPRDSQVFLHPDFKDCRPEAGGNWMKCSDKVKKKFAEYPQFNPWVYSFNVLLPVVDLQQEKSWGPMRTEFSLDLGEGKRIKVPAWTTNTVVLAELVFGWIASLLAIAAFSGLVKTD